MNQEIMKRDIKGFGENLELGSGRNGTRRKRRKRTGSRHERRRRDVDEAGHCCPLSSSTNKHVAKV